MKKTILTILGILGIVLLLGAIIGSVIWSHRNTAVALEEKIKAQYVSNQSNHDNMWKKFKEMTQVTDLQANQYKEVYQQLIADRNKDTNLLFKMVMEDNPKLDGAVYTQLQREIAAGRSTFDNNQKTMADIIREYNAFVRRCIVMSWMTGRQPKNVEDFIVTSNKTQKVFDSGKDDDIINLK